MLKQEVLFSFGTVLLTFSDSLAFLLSHYLRQMFLVAYFGYKFNFTSFFLPIFLRGYQSGGQTSGKIPLS